MSMDTYLDNLADQQERLAAETDRERFLKFHEANPHVYKKIVELAWEAKNGGFEHLGMRFLWERVRWWHLFECVDQSSIDAGYMMNDHHIAYYSRLVMDNEPGLKGFFRTRRMVGE